MLLALLLLTLPTVHAASDLPPPRVFASDGCTMFPDGIPKNPHLWYSCCFEHDLYYWAGGPQTREDATDQRLFECVRDIAGGRIARIMYLGVRAGHHSSIKMHTQDWGNSWPDLPRFHTRSPEELGALREAVQKMDIDETLRAHVLDSLSGDE